MPNIVLAGMMGSGKSTLGVLLAQTIEYDFVDIDSAICHQENTSIADIFAQHGESYFRQLESQTLQKICRNNQQVVAIGGGIVESITNRELLHQKNNLVIYLRTNIEQILLRISTDTARPLLNVDDKETALRDLICRREGYYLDVADIVWQNDISAEQSVIKLHKKLLDEQYI